MSVVPGASGAGAHSTPDQGAEWDAVAELWRDAAPQTLWRRHSDTVNSRLVESWLPGGLETVLKTDLWDEAHGEGLYPALAGRADRVVGIDISEEIVRSARARYPELDAHRCEIQHLPLEDASVEAIVSNSTLDHFASHAEIDRALVELHRVLRPGGTLLLTLDNPLNPLIALSKAIPHERLNRLWLRLGRAGAKLGILPYRVGVTYSRRRLERVLVDAGFRIEEETTLVHSPRILAVVVGHALEARAAPGTKERFLRLLDSAERLGGLPTRYVTGHFFGVRATRL